MGGSRRGKEWTWGREGGQTMAKTKKIVGVKKKKKKVRVHGVVGWGGGRRNWGQKKHLNETEGRKSEAECECLTPSQQQILQQFTLRFRST